MHYLGPPNDLETLQLSQLQCKFPARILKPKMLQILSTTLPIFILMAIGYGAVRSQLLSKDLLAGVGKFVLYFAVPSLIFKNLSESRLQEIVDPYFLSAYGLGSLACFILLFLFFRLVFNNSMTESSLKGFGSALPNSIFIGYPLLLQAFDEPPIAAFTMVLLIENLLIFPLALIMMDIGAAKNSRQNMAELFKNIAIRLAKNPVLIAILAGAAASIVDFELPSIAAKVVSMLAQASPAAALFFVGGLLVGTTIKGSVRSITAVTIGKLIIHPLLVAGCILLLPDFDPRLQLTAVLLAASPMLAIFPIIGAQYGHGPISASIMLVTTVSSFVTISAALWLISLQ